MEYFFEYFINTSSNYKLLAKNIQIFENKNTLGEIDFIIKNLETNEVLHIEFVYKYYLYFQKNLDEIQNLIGPNLNDSFFKKINKIKDKQFPIIKHNQVKDMLDDLGVKSITQKSCFLGNIFLPKNKDISFSKINNRCIKGFYISFVEFINDTEIYGENLYFLPHRFDWVNNPKSNEQWKNYKDIVDEVKIFIDLEKSPLVWMKTKEDKYEIFFITYYETI